MKKYKMTDEIILVNGIILHRIISLKKFGIIPKGRKGGFIEQESNLSQTGTAWVANDAKIYGNALVSENACVAGDAAVYDNAKIYGNAKLSEYACVAGNAEVFNNAKIKGYAVIDGMAHIYENAKVCYYSHICGDAKIHGEREVRMRYRIIDSGDFC